MPKGRPDLGGGAAFVYRKNFGVPWCHNHLMTSSAQQWQQKLLDAQLTTEILVDNLKETLEYCLRVGNGPWIETYNCLGVLDRLGNAVKRAHPAKKWDVDPVLLIQELSQRVRDFQEPMLDPYLLHLALLENDFKRILIHSLR
jgi:hypothetical protein